MGIEVYTAWAWDFSGKKQNKNQNLEWPTPFRVCSPVEQTEAFLKELHTIYVPYIAQIKYFDKPCRTPPALSLLDWRRARNSNYWYQRQQAHSVFRIHFVQPQRTASHIQHLTIDNWKILTTANGSYHQWTYTTVQHMK